jgi:formylglycine-generating enzyme required for sulfatase activity
MKLIFIALFLSLALFAEETKTNSLEMTLIPITPGSFMMGSPKSEVSRYSNETLHKVTLTRPFYMSQTEVTQKQWLSIMTETPQALNEKRLKEREVQKEKEKIFFSKLSASEKKAYKSDLLEKKKSMPVVTKKADKPTKTEKETQLKMRAFGAEQKKIAAQEKKSGKQAQFGDNFPMGFVNWSEAMAFCKELTERELKQKLIPQGWCYRLPTEAEWEYVARAGTTTPVYNGKQPDFRDEQSMTDFSQHAWINPYSTNRVHEVAQLKPNAWGFYDMLGNVTEWCLDIHSNFTEQETIDPIVTTSSDMMRIYRGLTAHNGPLDIRTARRKIGGPRVPYWCFFGFRVVLAQETKATSNLKDNHVNR